MKSQSKILVIDQAEVNGFAAACDEIAGIPQMRLIHQGNMTLQVPAPPAGSLASSVLDGIPYQIQNGRIARKKYHLSWVLLQKRYSDFSDRFRTSLCRLGTEKNVKAKPARRCNREAKIHTIFEGTSEIQQLVIARAISGLRIE